MVLLEYLAFVVLLVVVPERLLLGPSLLAVDLEHVLILFLPDHLKAHHEHIDLVQQQRHTPVALDLFLLHDL